MGRGTGKTGEIDPLFLIRKIGKNFIDNLSPYI